MKVKFLQTRTVQAEGGETFNKDQIYDMPETSARRWIERSVAIAMPDDAPVGAATTASTGGALLDKAVKAVKGLALARGKKGVQA